mgnify:CR=1 FL=1
MLYLTLFDSIQEFSNTLHNQLTSQQSTGCDSILVFAETSNTEQDYYEILGVKKDATKQEIHRAFRQLAKKYHPDKNKEKGASEEFMKIFKAYETLSDEKKRKDYDEQSKRQTHSMNGWHTTSAGMGDFDINEFFKQYEDQFMRHTQHFNQHNQHHHQHHHNSHERFTFHGVNLDDLFHDIDQDELSSFSNLFEAHNHNHFHHPSEDHYGVGDTYFGNLFPNHAYNNLHDHYHHQVHYANQRANGYSCKTVTRQVNGVMMTQTSCS